MAGPTKSRECVVLAAQNIPIFLKNITYGNKISKNILYMGIYGFFKCGVPVEVRARENRIINSFRMSQNIPPLMLSDWP